MCIRLTHFIHSKVYRSKRQKFLFYFLCYLPTGGKSFANSFISLLQHIRYCCELERRSFYKQKNLLDSILSQCSVVGLYAEHFKCPYRITDCVYIYVSQN